MAKSRGYSSKRDKGEKALIIILAFVMIAICLVMVQKTGDDGRREVGAFAWEIGGLDAEGNEIKNTACIRMKDGVSVDGLEIVIAEEADIKYSVFFFSVDEDGEETLVGVVADQTADLDATSIPEGAEVCRVVIQPTMDAEVGLFEINGYAQQLTITFNR